MKSFHWLRAATLASVGLVLGGVVQAQEVVADTKIAVAQASIQHAEQAGAPQLAPVDLASARDKLAQAKKAQTERDFRAATAMAEQADIDAQVAEANAVSQHSHAAAAEFDASMRALRNEAMRPTSTAQ